MKPKELSEKEYASIKKQAKERAARIVTKWETEEIKKGEGIVGLLTLKRWRPFFKKQKDDMLRRTYLNEIDTLLRKTVNEKAIEQLPEWNESEQASLGATLKNLVPIRLDEFLEDNKDQSRSLDSPSQGFEI